MPAAASIAETSPWQPQTGRRPAFASLRQSEPEDCVCMRQEGDKFSLALAKTVNLDNTPTDGTFNAVSFWLVSIRGRCCTIQPLKRRLLDYSKASSVGLSFQTSERHKLCACSKCKARTGHHSWTHMSMSCLDASSNMRTHRAGPTIRCRLQIAAPICVITMPDLSYPEFYRESSTVL